MILSNTEIVYPMVQIHVLLPELKASLHFLLYVMQSLDVVLELQLLVSRYVIWKTLRELFVEIQLLMLHETVSMMI